MATMDWTTSSRRRTSALRRVRRRVCRAVIAGFSASLSSSSFTTDSAPERRRALSPEAFGANLSALLAAPAPSTAQLAAQLRRPAKQAHEAELLERKALRLVQSQKHERQERCHVRDVIGGWQPRPQRPFAEWAGDDEAAAIEGGKTTAELEKDMRRLAQKGVVKLFNAIRVAQNVDAEAVAPSVKPKPLPTTTAGATPALPAGGTDASKANLLGGRGREQARASMCV